MPNRTFVHRNKIYLMTAFGLSHEYYGQAWEADEPRKTPDTAIAYATGRSYDDIFAELQTLLIERAQSHHYLVGGEALVGTCRKAPSLEPKYIGRLAFKSRPPLPGRLITYVEGSCEDEVFAKLDAEAKTFSEGLDFEIVAN